MEKNGILIVNKPRSMTSFGAIAKIRKILGVKKVGHTGTLDPMATGVLVVLIGGATKFQIFMKEHKKTYVAGLKFGITTDTQDITGSVIAKKSKFDFSFTELKTIVEKFKGRIMQVPPMFSAIKKNGQRLYKLARQGITVEREPRESIIEEIKLQNFDEKNKIAEITVTCSKGTYIRTLCDDIGEKLGCGAVMSSLRRTACNGFEIDKASEIDNISEDKILPTDTLFKNYDAVTITQNQIKRFRNGGNLAICRLQSLKNKATDGKIFRLYSGNSEFIGLGKANLQNSELKFLKAL